MIRPATRTRSATRQVFACGLSALGLLLLPAVLAAKEPAALYMMECQGCHLSDGAGGLDNIPTLKGNVANFPLVAGGREFLVQVPGVALSSLSDRELTAVLNWMLQTFGPREATRLYPPYSVSEVARLRKQPMTEVLSKRATLVALLKQSTAPR